MPVKRRGDKWQAQFRFYDEDGKQRSESRTFALKTDAENWLISRKQQSLQGRNKKLTTFVYLFDHYFAIYKEPYLRANTLASWNLARKAFLSNFSEQTYVQNINKDEYQRFITSYAQTRAHTTVLSVNRILSEVFRYAVDEGYINRSPATRVKIAGKKARNIQYLSVTQIKRLLSWISSAHFQRRRQRDVEIGTMYAISFAILSGCRLSEIAALTYNDIDFQNGIVHVRRQLNTRKLAKGNVEFTDLKTDASKRDIAMPVSYLKSLLKLHADGDEFIFYTQQNKPIQSSVMSYALKTALHEAHIDAEGFHFHSLRHSHVALLLSKGVDIYAISKRLGHARFDITLNTYAYLIDEQRQKNDKKIIKALDSLI